MSTKAEQVLDALREPAVGDEVHIWLRGQVTQGTVVRLLGRVHGGRQLVTVKVDNGRLHTYHDRWADGVFT